MIMKKLLTICSTLVACIALVACSSPEMKKANYEVIPLPKTIVKGESEAFNLDKSTLIAYPAENEKMEKNANFLSDYLHEMLGLKLSLTTDLKSTNAIILDLVEGENKEAYTLVVEANKVSIHGTSEAGVFYGIQTLRKSLPIGKNLKVSLPAVEIKDEPRFSYRGMMLDVSRHFFPLDFIKRYIDILALHNINTFHWHLTDDQGWRIEIKKYPKLTEIGSQRTETVIGHNSGEYDGIPYGGFFTQEEAKEIVEYAADHFITVIPEIDLPGHMQAALAAYPNLGCTGGPYEVWKQWGVSEDVLCAGNDDVLEFLIDVMDEIMEIFPSEYIHIGGDECPKSRWQECPKCQSRIKTLGLKADKKHSAEDYLQSFIMSHVEKYLNDNGRQIIGWDEIMEGYIAPNATVMSWRGLSGGIEAAKMKHDVVMAPTSHVYFDYYQTQDVENEPIAIGGYVPIQTVYSLEPAPAELTVEEQKYIIGTQANLWTEYIPTTEQVEYMVLPRMAALAEVQWCVPEQKDYVNFIKRLPGLMEIYALEGYNYAKHVFDIQAKLIPNINEGVIEVHLNTIDDAPIYYTLDGSQPTEASVHYEGVLKLNETCSFRAIAVRTSGNSKVFSEEIDFNKATMKPITLLQPLNERYKYGGETTLVDGLKGNLTLRTTRWLGLSGNDLEAVINLKSEQEVSSVDIRVFVDKSDWVFDSRGFEISVSTDGENFKNVLTESYLPMKETDENGIKTYHLTFDPIHAQYIKVKGLSEHNLPEWHDGKGKPGFLFIDEIGVN